MLAATGAVTRESQLRARGWTDADWDEAAARLEARGLLAGDRLTPAGVALHTGIEATTDRLAAAPWVAVGDSATTRFDELIEPIAEAIAAAAVISYPNPMGLPPPG